MNLALVIPVRNDQSNLNRLLTQVGDMDIFDQVIIVDDASNPPVTVPDCLPGSRKCPVQLIQQETAGGAGAARNRAIPEINTDHVIFFDSDDLFTSDFAPLWQSLKEQDFDFCLFRYHDTERGYYGGQGQIPHDEACWRLAGINPGVSSLQTASEDGIWALAEASNFPWNKIYCSSFLRTHGLRCTEIPVHNDIELHWRSFLAAKRILVSNHIAAMHVVRPNGTRLTNRRNTERLRVFEALTQVANCIASQNPSPRATLAFLRFSSGLLVWIHQVIEESLRMDLHTRTRTFLDNTLGPETYADLTYSDPVLALQLSLQMGLTPPPLAAAASC